MQLDGQSRQEVGVLDEDFTYSDGTKGRRVWTLKRGADGKFTEPLPMSWAMPMAKKKAMRFAGATP